MSSDSGLLLGEALPSFLITFREGLEAFLLVGIMLSYLERVNAQRYKRYVFYGVGAGLAASLAAAFVFQVLVSQFENDYYRSCLMIAVLLAHVFLAYFVGVDTLAQWVRRSPVEHPTTFFLMLGIPTHFDRADGTAAAIESHVHLFSDHVQAALGCGFALLEMVEGVVDEAWLAKKPKWSKYAGHPVSFAMVWGRIG